MFPQFVIYDLRFTIHDSRFPSRFDGRMMTRDGLSQNYRQDLA